MAKLSQGKGDALFIGNYKAREHTLHYKIVCMPQSLLAYPNITALLVMLQDKKRDLSGGIANLKWNIANLNHGSTI